jgi:hypothetical protein
MVKTEYRCKDEKCERVFACYNSMYAHYQANHKPARYECPVCHLRYKRHVSRCLHYYQSHVQGVVPKIEKKEEQTFSFQDMDQAPPRTSLGNYNFITLF